MKKKQNRKNLIDRYLSGESVASILNDTSIPRSTLYSWLKQHHNEQQIGEVKEVSAKNFRMLENKVERFEGIVRILKMASCTATSPLHEKLVALESLYGQYNVHMLCEALDVSRGTFYNHILRNKKEDTTYAARREQLKIKIKEVYDDYNQIFGAGKIAAVMKNEGYKVSEEMVLELMREIGIKSIRQGAKSLYLKEKRATTNHLRQNFQATAPNQVWVSDVTFFRWKEKTYYICVIMDLFARMVVGHRISYRNSTHLVKSTFKQAYENRTPNENLTFHSDQGSNYRSNTFRNYLESLNVEQSFSRPHQPHDNAVMETFFSHMKKEELYRRRFQSENEFMKAVDGYMEFHNTTRPHSTLKNKTPKQFEKDFLCNHGVSEFRNLDNRVQNTQF